jgi:hypothetical protein
VGREDDPSFSDVMSEDLSIGEAGLWHDVGEEGAA